MFKTWDFPSSIWHQPNSKFFFYNCESIMFLEKEDNGSLWKQAWDGKMKKYASKSHVFANSK